MSKDISYEQMLVTSQDRFNKIMKHVINKCKNDKTFEHNLLNNPTEILKQEGLELQPNVSFQTVKTEEEARLLPNNVIPFLLKEKQGPLSEEDLDKVVGGGSAIQIIEGLFSAMGFDFTRDRDGNLIDEDGDRIPPSRP